MGIKRETYERRFRELFAEVVSLVDREVEEWRKRKIEVRKNQVSQEKFIYIVEFQGRPLNAFALEFYKDSSGYPHIFLCYDSHKEEIYRLHRKPEVKNAQFLNFRSLLATFIEDTILAEAKRIALQEGFFAALKRGDLFVPIGGYEFRLRYLEHINSWKVKCDDLTISWALYECGDYHPLEFLPHLLKALPLRHLL
jgi:hypothetical protein